jgi:signal transduction histidine kinase/DNA-binding response OmpR family regulator
MNELAGNILIVDDLLENLQVLDKMLKNEGYKVRKAINGETALRACQSSFPDVILLDIKMPEMDGFEVCQRLKSDQKTKDIPVIFISALDETFNKIKAFNIGGIDYITKPFNEEEVIARIKNQLIIQNQKKLLQEEIKQRKETEAILYQSRSLISSILNSALDGIAGIEAIRDNVTSKVINFRCLLVNPVIANFFSSEEEHLINQTDLKNIINKIDPKLFDEFVKVVETGISLKKEISYNHNQQKKWYHFIAVKLGDGFAITVRDITERKRKELELKQANQELEAFNYSVAHDLRNPINNIKLLAQLIQGEIPSLDEQNQKYLEFIHQSAEKMSQIVKGLLTLFSLKKQKVNIDSFDLSFMVEEIIENLRFNSPTRKASINIQKDIIIKADKKLLRIALENLVNNAWKYSSKKEHTCLEFGVISWDELITKIRLNPENQCNFLSQEYILKNNPFEWIYFIKDNGAGFELTKAQDLFTPFKRFHSDVEFEGTGIGLSIVERIINYHQGLIWCHSQVNQGTTFYFTLGTN